MDELRRTKDGTYLWVVGIGFRRAHFRGSIALSANFQFGTRSYFVLMTDQYCFFGSIFSNFSKIIPCFGPSIISFSSVVRLPFVWLNCQNAVHYFVLMKGLDCVFRRISTVISDNSRGQRSAEVILLDQTFLKSSLSGEKFLKLAMALHLDLRWWSQDEGPLL